MSLQPEAIAYHTDGTGSSFFFGSGGGGATSLPLNNGVSGTVGSGIVTISPNAPAPIGIKAVVANYSTYAPSYIPLCLAQLADIELTSATVPVTGDTLSFYVQVSVDGGGTYVLTPAVNTPATAITGGTFYLQFNPQGVIPAVTPGPHLYKFELMVLYSTTGDEAFDLNKTTAGSFSAEVLACSVV